MSNLYDDTDPDATIKRPAVTRPITEQIQALPARAKPSFIRRNCLTLAIVIFLACVITPAALAECANGPTPIVPTPTPAVLHPTALPTEALTVRRARPDFETGMVFPRWERTAYGTQDTTWQQGLQDIRNKTCAGWIELPVLFKQPTNASLSITATSSTPSALLAGIQYAHSRGYHVFVIPLIDVDVPGDWAGTITPENIAVWFAHYWTAYLPYVQAAQQGHAEQLAIGTEMDWLQEQAPEYLWAQLIGEVKGTFSGKVTYDENWTAAENGPVAPWLTNKGLDAIGMSEYTPLTQQPILVSPTAIASLWRTEILPMLDTLAQQTGKPVILSEIGFRNDSLALYNTWASQRIGTPDPQLQAAAVNAVLSSVLTDLHIVGTFWWGWQDVGDFQLAGLPAQDTIDQWYTSPLA